MVDFYSLQPLTMFKMLRDFKTPLLLPFYVLVYVVHTHPEQLLTPAAPEWKGTTESKAEVFGYGRPLIG